MFNPPHGTNDKTMRTKTPHQIFEQWRRMSRNATTRTNIERVKRAAETTCRYWDNIYKANGIADRYKCSDTAKCNEIYYTAAMPASIYAKQTEV